MTVQQVTAMYNRTKKRSRDKLRNRLLYLSYLELLAEAQDWRNNYL